MTDCVIPTQKPDSNGYVRLWIDGRKVLAHRAAWERENGPIPPGLTIDHLCRTKPCVNVGHMEVVTRSENGRRGRAGIVRCKRGHDDWGPRAENPRWRYCRACNRERMRVAA